MGAGGPAQPAVFALEATRALGERVAAHLGRPLAAHEEREFEYGQHKARPLESVRGRACYVIQSLHGEPGASANDKLCRLLFFVGALRDAAAASVTAVVPFLCYARKDRKTKPRDPVTTRYVASLFEAVGTDRVVTLDVHNLSAFQNAFRCRTEHLEARPLFVRHFGPLARAGCAESEPTGDGAAGGVVVVSPDIGGAKGADRFRAALASAAGCAVPAAFLEKRREEGVISGEAVVGAAALAGRAAIIFDDMIVSGGTMLRAAEACRAAGAREVHAAATHAAFTPEARALFESPTLDSIVVLDAIPPFALNPSTLAAKLVTLPAGPLLAEAIRRLHDGGSLVALAETGPA